MASVTKLEIANFLGQDSLIYKEESQRIFREKNFPKLKVMFAILTIWTIVAPFILRHTPFLLVKGSFAPFFFKAGGILSIPFGLLFIYVLTHRNSGDEKLDEADIRGIINRETENCSQESELRKRIRAAAFHFFPNRPKMLSKRELAWRALWGIYG